MTIFLYDLEIFDSWQVRHSFFPNHETGNRAVPVYWLQRTEMAFCCREKVRGV